MLHTLTKLSPKTITPPRTIRAEQRLPLDRLEERFFAAAPACA